MPFSLIRYSQQDPLWRNDKLGSGPDSIGDIGCALTSLAMYSGGWGLGETPATLNQKLKAHGGFVQQAIVWGAISKIHPEIKSTGLTVCNNVPAPLSQINASLMDTQPVIVEVDFSPAPGFRTHWIVLYARLGDDYLMLDPWPYPTETQQATLMGRFSHGKPLQRAIKAVAWFRCSLAEPSPAPSPVETDLYIRAVASASAGLRLHQEPSLDSAANYAEMPGVPLNVIEEVAGTLANIGQPGQWIHVRDPQGHQGYVAAWFVEAVPEGAPAPTPVPPPASEPRRFQVVVLANVGPGGLAVRQQPAKGAAKVNNEKAGARLTVVEPASTGLPKIGVAGKWLAVKATNNRTGYVAAQYVRLRE